MRPQIVGIGISLLLGLTFPATLVQGKAEAPALFCSSQPDALDCKAANLGCDFCHNGPPALNPYGLDLQPQIGSNDFVAGLSIAVANIADADSDQDGALNGAEIAGGSLPGDANSLPAAKVEVAYDVVTAFKRMQITYCGRPATYADLQTLQQQADKMAFLHSSLDQCLASEYWLKEALYRMADQKIRPTYAIGQDGPVVIGDYSWDYRLYAYIMSGDRDTRELLTARYHIDPNGNRVEGQVGRGDLGFQVSAERIVIAGGQPLAAGRRAGMMTTQWFLSVNTMFSDLPRTTAAQAYRAYLGYDIAKGEGLFPVADEPRDVDNKNVAQPECAVCHSTLDPLAYSFSTYKGIEIDFFTLLFNGIGTYDGGRTPWEADGYLFGEPVDDLMSWVEKAKDSDAFKRKVALDIFQQALGRSPLAHEAEEFDALWKSMPGDGYSAHRLIHRLIDTQAFGGNL